MTLSAAERERRALIWANRPPPRTDAERARAYRDRLRAIRDAPEIEAARIATIHRRQELAIIAERNRITQEIERQEREAKELATRQAAEVARRAEQARVQAGIEDGTLHPSGRPWLANEARARDLSSPRAMVEAGRRAALQQAVDSFDRTGALKPDELGPRPRRPDTLFSRYSNPWADWHRDY